MSYLMAPSKDAKEILELFGIEYDNCISAIIRFKADDAVTIYIKSLVKTPDEEKLKPILKKYKLQEIDKDD